MGRHAEYLGSSLIRLIMVRLYDQSNIAFAHDIPILSECSRQGRMHMSFSRLPMFKVVLAAPGPGFCGRGRSQICWELMGHSDIHVDYNVYKESMA